MTSPVGRWDFCLSVDPALPEPLFLQIARAIVADIQRGRIRPGERLPGTRTLAQTLAVHRNTVVAGYAELLAEGWIEATAARGTFVSRSLPEPRPRRFSQRVAQRTAVPSRLAYDLERPPPEPELEAAPPST